MAQFNVHEAKSKLSQLLELALSGEEVILAKHGTPIARLVPMRRPGLVLGSGKEDPNINREVLSRDDWWQPMTDEEAEAWYEGRS
jgi:prevent-host-death family protein